MLKQRSFTIIELLVVIAIIGLLAAIVLVSLKEVKERARIARGVNFDAQVFHGLGFDAIGIWELDEGIDNTCPGNKDICDSSDEGNDGENSGAQWDCSDTVTGEGCSLVFNGVSDYVYAKVGDWMGLNNAPWTVSAWFKSFSSGGPIVGITNSPPGGGWNMPFMSLSSDGVLYGWAWGGGQVSKNVGFGKWIFGVVAYDPIKGIKLYVDGELADLNSNTGYSASGSTDYWTTYISGAKPSNVPSYFNGKIDEVRIYKQSLSSAQIKKLYVRSLKYKKY